MRRANITFFALLTILLLSVSSIGMTSFASGSEDLSRVAIKYLGEVSMEKVKNVETWQDGFRERGVWKEYRYFLNWSSGNGLAEVFLVNGKVIMVKYNLNISSVKISSVCANFIKNSLGIAKVFSGWNIGISNKIQVYAVVFPGTKLYKDTVNAYVYLYHLIKVNNLTINETRILGGATIIMMGGRPVSLSLNISPHVIFPPSNIKNSKVLTLSNDIFSSIFGSLPPENKTVTLVREKFDLLGEEGGSTMISTQGKVSLQGDVGISLNSFGQIIWGEMSEGFPQNASVIKIVESRVGNNVTSQRREYLCFLLEVEKAKKEYYKFLGAVANYINNKDLRNFFLRLEKNGEKVWSSMGGYFNSTFNEKGGEHLYNMVASAEIGGATLKASLHVEMSNLGGTYYVMENGEFRLLNLPRPSLTEERAKISSKEVESTIKSLLGQNYSVNSVFLEYVPRMTNEVPVYYVTCRSPSMVLKLTVSGIDGEIVGASYSFTSSQSSTSQILPWIGAPAVAVVIGIVFARIYRRRRS